LVTDADGYFDLATDDYFKADEAIPEVSNGYSI
jgi:hypothetical protein